jgi:hypothetical protein
MSALRPSREPPAAPSAYAQKLDVFEKLYIATHNVNGNLHGRRGETELSKANYYADWIEETRGVLLLQHTNIVGEDVPGDVQQAFDDHVVRVWGATDEPTSSVAVVAHRRWKVKQKFCHPSGRVLGVELAAGLLPSPRSNPHSNSPYSTPFPLADRASCR